VQETHDVKTFRLVPINGGPFPFDYRPGQFINLQLTIAERRVNRSYTLASSPSRSDHCELTIKRDPEGLASKYMHDQVRVGDLLKISGPSGKFTFSGDEADAVLLIAGGVGITPVMSILRFLSDRSWQGDIYFVVVSKTEEDLIFREEMRGLKQRLPRLHLRETLTRAEQNHAWQGDRGRISADLLTGFVPRLHETPVFLCGPNDMMDATCQLLSAHGVPASLIHTEAFAGRKSSDPKSPALPLVVPEVAAGRSALQTSSSPTRIIRFFRSNVQAEIDAETTVLEAAEAVSVVLPYECRSGICGQCKTRLIEGLVAMDCEDALSAQEKAAGFILSCQARLLNPAVVDA
jgi:ferredoxin-NADP reductase